MTAFRDPKAMAKTLRMELTARDIDLPHSACLEVVARQLGYANWNTAHARHDGKQSDLQMPEGWFAAGSNKHDYDMGVDADIGAATIRSKRDGRQAVGFATLMQTIDAKAYCGKRVRFRGELSTKDAAGRAMMWLRIDDKDGRQFLLDNMEHREEGGVLRGTTDWAIRSIIVDVPDNAGEISYGLLMDGNGQCWCREFDLQVVDLSKPVTRGPDKPLEAPKNMRFLTESDAA